MSHLSPEQLDAAAKGQAFDHVTSCAECRQALVDARGRQKLLSGLVPYTLSDMAFRRVEAQVLSRLQEPEPAWWPRALAWAAGAIALAAVAALVWPRAVVTPQPPPVATVAPVKPKLPSLPTLTVLAAKNARVRVGDQPWVALLPRAEVGAGATVNAERVLLAPATTTSPTLALAGVATFDEVLALGAGSLDVKAAEPFALWAGPRRVEASSARFVVNRAAAETMVDLTEGQVDLVDDATFVRRTLKAPAHVRWADAEKEPVVSSGVAPATVLAVPQRPWAWLDMSSLGPVKSLALDGQSVEAASMLAMAEGKHRLTGATVAGVSFDRLVNTLAGAPTVLELPTEKDGPAPTPDVINRLATALQANTPKLAVCYERWLKATPTAEGEVVMALSVDAKGRVVSVHVSGALPAGPKDCLVRTTRRLVLPAPGTAVDLELPLKLRAGR